MPGKPTEHFDALTFQPSNAANVRNGWKADIQAIAETGSKRTSRLAQLRCRKTLQYLTGLPQMQLCFNANDFNNLFVRCHPFRKMAAGDSQQVLDRRYCNEIEGARITRGLKFQMLIPRQISFAPVPQTA